MNDNLEITKKILCNNIIGSFYLVCYRTREKGIIDCISKNRIAVYHFVIIRNEKKLKFFDMMEEIHSHGEYELRFNSFESRFPDITYDWDIRDIEEVNKKVTFRKIEFRKSFIKQFISFLKQKNKIQHIKTKKIEDHRVDKVMRDILKQVIDILKHQNEIILNNNHPLFSKLCAYRGIATKGQDLPIYYVRTSGRRIRHFKLIKEPDILRMARATKDFKDSFKFLL